MSKFLTLEYVRITNEGTQLYCLYVHAYISIYKEDINHRNKHPEGWDNKIV